MTSAEEEEQRIAEAVARVVAEAPPIPAEVLAMLRRDRFPFKHDRKKRTEADDAGFQPHATDGTRIAEGPA